MKKILVIFGTRPEAIKLGPLIKLLSEDARADLSVCVTAQHRQMLDQVMELFDIVPNYDLNVMARANGLYELTGEILQSLAKVLEEDEPELVLVHGDTTTTLASSIAAFYRQIPVGHVEAGLRTGDIYAPWPEEVNRKIATVISKYHFCPTEESQDNLLREGIHEEDIYVTGNTVIDALFYILKRIEGSAALKTDLDRHFDYLNKDSKTILVTGHRRENIGIGLERICESIKRIALRNPGIQIVYPVHLNPNVLDPVKKYLDRIDNVFLTSPMDYTSFVYLMNMSYLVLTDSGGVQEEAPSLGKPVLVMRDVTERPEAVLAGTVKLVGTGVESIVSSVESLLSDESAYLAMSRSHNPYGDGRSSRRIAEILLNEGMPGEA